MNNSNFNELTAISLRLVKGVLENALYDLNPGRLLDVPTAKDGIEQAMRRLDRIADILDPTVSNVVKLPEMKDGDPDTEWVNEGKGWELQKIR